MARQNKNIGMDKILKNIDKRYHNSNEFLGKSLLTKPSKLNSARGLMFSSHLDQFEPLNNPEVPKLSYGYENMVGEYSSGYYKTDKEYVIVDKICKFDFDENTSNKVKNLSYLLVVYDEENDIYDVIQKVNFEKLTEDYGYKYKTAVMDSYEVGETIPNGEVLYRSVSYDESMNYRYGLNATTVFMIDTDTTEDAIKMRRGFAEKFDSTKIDIVRIPMNTNDVLINLLGKGDEYKAFPDVGEKIQSKILAAQRRLNYSQMLFDMKIENLSRPNYMTDTPFYAKYKGRVVDINIYCNKDIEDLDDSLYNQQIIKYAKNSLRYHEEVVKVLTKYKEKGKVGDELNYHLKKSMEVLDPETKWRDSNDSVFDNMIIEFSILKKHKVQRGTKFTGRTGNKGVASMLVEDEDMPIVTETGKPVDIIINALGPFGRLNPPQLEEVETNFITNRVLELYIRPEKDLEKKKEYLFEIVKDFNYEYGERFEDFFNGFTINQQEEIMQEVERQGIRIEENPFWNNSTLDTFRRIYDKWDIPKYHLHTYRFGRKVKILNTHVVGEMYLMKLKHTAAGKFSARSTAQVSTLDLPEKSSATKNNKALFSATPVKLTALIHCA